MNETKDKENLLDCNKDQSKPFCTTHQEEIRLFCTECQDILCIECMLEKHQKHDIKKLSEAIDIIKQIVQQWCLKDSTLSNITTKKKHFERLLETSNVEKRTFESDLRKRETDLKSNITEEANTLSSKLKEAFQNYDDQVQLLVNEVSGCEKGIQQFDVESTSLVDMLFLYCSFKSCLRTEFIAVTDSPRQPRLSLNTESFFSLGVVEPDLDKERTSQVAKINTIAEKNIEAKTIYPLRIPAKFDIIGSVKKIIPTRNEEAYILFSRGVHYLKKSVIEIYLYNRVIDDIALCQNDNLFTMKEKDKIIEQVASNKTKILFTCTDPYIPKGMAYLNKTATLMVLMKGRTIFTFGMDGIKQSSFNLPCPVFGYSIDAFSCNEFSILCKINNTYLTTNCIFCHKENPVSYVHFNGIFGCEPAWKFICKSICYDDEGYIIVSDYTFNTVYRLDKKCELQKILIDRHAGLDSPTALGLKNGMLFVADFERISIYQYSDDD